MRLSRMTTRRWMILVALAALCLVAVRAIRTIGGDIHMRAVDDFWINHPGVTEFHLEGSDDRPPPRPWWVLGQ